MANLNLNSNHDFHEKTTNKDRWKMLSTVSDQSKPVAKHFWENRDFEDMFRFWTS